jgi:hypothetical protein
LFASIGNRAPSKRTNRSRYDFTLRLHFGRNFAANVRAHHSAARLFNKPTC